MDLPGFIIGFREGLESFLLISLALNTLKHVNAKSLMKQVWYGAVAGVLLSVLAGVGLHQVSEWFSASAKVWESIFSFLAVLLITTLIFWMIRHSKNMKAYVKKHLHDKVTRMGVFAFSLVIILREGAEVALFSLAGDYTASSIAMGIGTALVLAILLYFSLVKVPLSLIFQITLAYLILQAGYLLGYSVHEALSAMKGAQLAESHWLYLKAFDFSDGILNHKSGSLGLPLHLILGWYSKPEWIPFVLHYSYVGGVFSAWLFRKRA